MTAGLPLMKSVLIPLAKNVLLPFWISAGMSAADPAFQKKIYESGTTALATSDEEMEGIIKIIKSLEESGLLIERISETTKKCSKNKVKGHKRGFLLLLGTLKRMLLGTLTATVLGSTLTGEGVIRAGERTTRVDENFNDASSFN